MLQGQSRDKSLVLIPIRSDFYIKAFSCNGDIQYGVAVLSSSIISVCTNYKTNQYTSSPKMLSGILLVPFSHSPAANSPYDKIN